MAKVTVTTCDFCGDAIPNKVSISDTITFSPPKPRFEQQVANVGVWVCVPGQEEVADLCKPCTVTILRRLADCVRDTPDPREKS